MNKLSFFYAEKFFGEKYSLEFVWCYHFNHNAAEFFFPVVIPGDVYTSSVYLSICLIKMSVDLYKTIQKCATHWHNEGEFTEKNRLR